jgi:hypothetical protein
MKFPNHIILDVSKQSTSYSNQYWIFKYIYSLKSSNIDKTKNTLNSNFPFYKKFFLTKENLIINKLTSNQALFTLKYSFSNYSIFLSDSEQNFFKKVYEPRRKVKHKVLNSKAMGKEVYDYLLAKKKWPSRLSKERQLSSEIYSFASAPNNLFDKKSLERLFESFNLNFNNTNLYKISSLWSLFDINFLKKEKIYTKLKYSRVPQYDIVSGGAAAIFAGFLGFLISEKFGWELVDSGDFYFLFMYLVFIFFFCRLFLKIMNHDQYSWNILSLKWLFFFIKNVIFLLNKFVASFFKK